jgi:hypothetical protein
MVKVRVGRIKNGRNNTKVTVGVLGDQSNTSRKIILRKDSTK